jgi:hypothetical protein
MLDDRRDADRAFSETEFLGGDFDDIAAADETAAGWEAPPPGTPWQPRPRRGGALVRVTGIAAVALAATALAALVTHALFGRDAHDGARSAAPPVAAPAGGALRAGDARAPAVRGFASGAQATTASPPAHRRPISYARRARTRAARPAPAAGTNGIAAPAGAATRTGASPAAVGAGTNAAAKPANPANPEFGFER